MQGADILFVKGASFTIPCGQPASAASWRNCTGKAQPDLAYTAGLLHDIGKVILDQYMHSAYPLFYRQLQIQGNDLTAAGENTVRHSSY